jgi:peptidoglycan biosynthesis protein MviN/MurJ (putative lipid II flippase)
VFVQAPKSDIFVAMLGVALGAILLACLLMLMILWRYDFKVNSKLAARDSGVQNLSIAARSAVIATSFPPASPPGAD